MLIYKMRLFFGGFIVDCLIFELSMVLDCWFLVVDVFFYGFWWFDCSELI